MADVRLNIASREYIVTCRDGEEPRLLSLGAMVDDMVKEAGGAAGGLNESRQLLFASLLLADKLHDQGIVKANGTSNTQAQMASNESSFGYEQIGITLERLADRLESLSDKLEN
jgi:cell division protein ZapA